jgi:hypothetical protein
MTNIVLSRFSMISNPFVRYPSGIEAFGPIDHPSRTRQEPFLEWVLARRLHEAHVHRGFAVTPNGNTVRRRGE